MAKPQRTKRENPVAGMRLRRGSWEFRKVINGERKYFRLETDDIGEAIKRKTEILGNPDLVPSEGILTDITKFIAYKKRRQEYSVQSQDVREYILNKFAEFVNNKPLIAITEKDIKRYYESKLAELKESTANSYLMAVRAFFGWAHKERIIRRNPCLARDAAGDLVIEPIVITGSARKDFCTIAQVKKLLDECDNKELKFVLYCGFHAGMRKQEITEAVPWWFDMEHRRIDMRKHEGIEFKDREERSIPMTPEFHAFLQDYGLRDPYMIAPNTKKGRARYRYDFRRPFEEYVASKGLDWVTPHIMRHTFASLLASSGVSIYLIATWMGDDVRVVQNTYAKLLPLHNEIERAFKIS